MKFILNELQVKTEMFYLGKMFSQNKSNLFFLKKLLVLCPPLLPLVGLLRVSQSRQLNYKLKLGL